MSDSDRSTQPVAKRWHGAIIGLALLAVSGCDTASRQAGKAPDGDRMVEAPDIFRATDTAGWSEATTTAKGIWALHPAIATPRQAIIRRPENGRFAIGGLFPSAPRDQGAPPISISAEAAHALGLDSADAPAIVEVVALSPLSQRPAILPAPIQVQRAPAARAEPDPLLPDMEAVRSQEPQLAVNTSPEPPEPLADPSRLPRRPYLQVGLFESAAAASEAIRILQANGIIATFQAGQVAGSPRWRVAVGPVPSRAERRTLLTLMNHLGFAEATPVRQ